MKQNQSSHAKLQDNIVAICLFIAAHILAISWLYNKTQTISTKQHFVYLNNLENMAKLDSTINSEVLASFTMLVRNYDALNANLKQLMILSKEVTKVPPFVLNQDQHYIRQLAQDTFQDFYNKQYQVDSFKRHHAVYRNSLNYFPKLAKQLLVNKPNLELKHYIQGVLAYVNLPSDGQLSNLNKLAATINQANESLLNDLISHGGVLIRYRNILAKQLESITQSASSDLLTELNVQYMAAYQRAETQSDVYRLFMFIIAITLCLYLAYIFIRLARTRADLKQTIVELKQRYTAQQDAEAKLTLHDAAFTNASEAIAITDSKVQILEVNPAFSKITGYQRDEVIGKNPSVLQSGKHDAAFYQTMWQQLSKDGFWRGEIWNKRKDGEIYPELLSITAIKRNNAVKNYVAVFTDVSILKQQEVKLKQMAYFDELTKLPNRTLLTDRIQQAMNQCQRSNQLMAVAFLDFDGFKQVNDQFGHHIGNQLLITMSERFQSCIRQGDSVARLGGDEFVFLLVGLHNEQEYQLAIKRILDSASKPMHLDGQRIKVSASIGVTLYPADDNDADTLLRNADQAMYTAKQLGKNRYHLFDTAKNDQAVAQNQQLIEIKQALKNEEFILHYQPKVNLRTGEVIGAEALVRWLHPEKGLLFPNSFLPVIENTELIVTLGNYVLTHALEQLNLWHQQGIDLKLSVNVASKQLKSDNFFELLQSALNKHPDVPANKLELEVLETTALDDIHQISQLMTQCQSLGVDFSLDDFGTGYSSLTYLKQLPASKLKIDMSFIRGMLTDSGHLAIVHGTLGLASAFQKLTIAEGVETIEHGNMLIKLGCHFGQGYAISKPLPASEFELWLATWSIPESWVFHGSMQWDDIDFSIFAAEVEHNYYVQNLIAAANKQQQLSEEYLKSATSCQFANWYYKKGQHYYGHLPSFQKLEGLHNQVHLYAEHIQVALEKQNDNEVDDLVSKLTRVHRNLLSELKKLSVEVATPVVKKDQHVINSHNNVHFISPK